MTIPETAAVSPAFLSEAGLRVFIVEDHRDTLDCLRRRLTRMGHTVFSAECAAEAMAKLPEADCDVLLSDIGLPDGSGWELLPEVRPLLSRPLYAIAMSGYGESADRGRSSEAGFRRHLVKPFRAAELQSALKAAAESCRRGDAKAAEIEGGAAKQC